MPIKYYTVAEGGGTLSIGGLATAKDFTAQVRSCTVTWKKDQDDAVPVLSGDELGGQVTYTATLEATFIQDLTEDGLVDFTWDNAGEDMPFTYEPSSTAGRTISGTVTIDPLDVGGDAKAKAPTSDVKWACVGRPTIAAGLT